MKSRTKTIIPTATSVASALAVGLISSLAATQLASALTYQDTTEVEFTFNPTINVSLSSTNLIIPELASGSGSDSNQITVSVSTNAGYGYYLSATTGATGGNTNLTNTADSNYKFTSLSSNAPTLSAMPDNSWGYSYSTDNGTTWVSGDNGSALTGYNGLPLDNDDSGATGIKLLSSDTFASTGSVKFKIGARASATQASGTYTGTVNFYAVTNPGPQTIANSTTMQEVTSCPSSLATEQIYTIKDSRDNQTYAVAKLADGKCWMVENLNLAGGTALSANDTDVTSTYISSFTTSNNLTKSGDTIVLPASDNGSSSFSQNNYSYVYNSGNKTSNCTSPGCYSYYSWDAATLGSGRSLNTENTDAEQSICPKGWRLPTSGATSSEGWKRGDFYTLATAYGANLETNYYESSATFYNNAGPGTIPNFLLAGYYYYGSFSSGGSYGSYWSSTSYSSTSHARYLYFSISAVYSADYFSRLLGLGVRCLFSGQ